MRVLILTKRQYTGKDLIDDRFGRLWEIPFSLAARHHVKGLCLSYQEKSGGRVEFWESINSGMLKIPGLIQFILRADCLAKDADVIWACSDSIYGIIGFILSKKHNIPLVFDLYDNFEYFLLARLPIVKQIYRAVVRKCDAVTCVSAPLKHLVDTYGRTKNNYIIENAVPAGLFSPLDKEKCRYEFKLPKEIVIVGSIGALAKNRGTKYLINAFFILQKKYPDLHLVLAGPCSIPIPEHDRIHYLGNLPMDKIPLAYNALDVAVICNRDNAFGRYCFPQKAREIMACNIPLIAADVGSMKLLLKDHPDWMYVHDNAQSLARTLENRLENQGTGYPEVTTWQDMANKLEEVFYSLREELRPTVLQDINQRTDGSTLISE
ncbi:glycosyltransferase family 4 protein [uncultured Desulfobacter sp.]|uniref:glycosyltransferase family 4 protein n=1 Tax=uncultured Desulfobacter sp. TaxID=240139 RepID=UPI002AA93709|nr:glycosyltransferase family 4 protein [uncultured Desulfobacter sp.]